MATYKIIGTRFLRQYTEEEPSPVYAANIEAEEIVSGLCNIPWKQSQVKKAQMTYHTDDVVDDKGTTGFNKNAEIRESFDAAMWCGEHSGGKHRAYANAAVYRWTLPDNAPSITSLKVHVTSDPYNSSGVRLHLFTSNSPDIPTSCLDLRGEDSSGDIINDGTAVAGAAPRTTRTIDNKEYWYPTGIDVTITPANGLAAQKYLFLFVGLEDYSVVRGNWIEGSSFIDNLVDLTTSADVQGWTAGETYDLSAPPEYDHTYNVTVDGVYPCVFEGNSGVQSITLQKNGEALSKYVHPSESTGEDVLRLLKNGVFEPFNYLQGENLQSTKITCIHSTRMYFGSNLYQDYLVIGGTFNGGTFKEIPGLYLYNLTTNAFVPEQSLGSDVPEELGRFYSVHGGFECCHFVYFGKKENRIGVFTVAKDGTTFRNTTPYQTTNSWQYSRVFPGFSIQRTSDDMFTAIEWPYYENYASPTISICNIKDTFSGFSVKYFSVGRCVQHWPTYDLLGGATVTIGFLSEDNRVIVSQLLFAGQGTGPFGNSPTFSTAMTWATAQKIKGNVYSSIVHSYIMFMMGEITKIGDNEQSDRCLWYEYLDTQVSNSSTQGSGGFTSTNWGFGPITYVGMPDKFDNIALYKGIGYDAESILIAGDFSKLGSVNAARLAKYKYTSSTPAPSAIQIPVDYGANPYIAALKEADDSVYFARVNSRSLPYDYYPHIHANISASQSAIGLRTLYAMLYQNRLTYLSQDDVYSASQNTRPGAMFTVSGNTIEDVPTGDNTKVDVPTWQLTVSNLSIPFALPTAWRACKLRLSWGTFSNFTTGAKINAWIKPGYLSDNPRIDDVAIYDASKDEVDGWRRLGTFAPDATMTGVTGHAVEFDLDVVNTNNEIGRMATLLLTAYINLDDVNPASGSGGSGDTPALPQGVGAVSVNPIAGSITRINTGFKPDITLFG